MRRKRRSEQVFLIGEEPPGEAPGRALGRERESEVGREEEVASPAAVPAPAQPSTKEEDGDKEWEPLLDPEEEAEPRALPAVEPEVSHSPPRRYAPRRPLGRRWDRERRPVGTASRSAIAGVAERRPARLAALVALCLGGALALTLAIRAGSPERPPQTVVEEPAGLAGEGR